MTMLLYYLCASEQVIQYFGIEQLISALDPCEYLLYTHTDIATLECGIIFDFDFFIIVTW